MASSPLGLQRRVTVVVPVKVKFYGVIKNVVDEREAELVLPDGSRVRDLIASLAERYGPRFAERMLTSEGHIQNYVKMLFNDNPVNSTGLETRLSGTAESPAEVIVHIIPSYGGG